MTAARAVVLAVLVGACASDDAGTPAAVSTAPSTVAPAAAPAAPSWIGVTAPADAVDVAPAFEGVVATVAVRPGDKVEVAATLATLDERQLREEVDAVAAQVREASAAARRAGVEVERARYRLRINQAGFAAGTESAALVEDSRLAGRAAEAAAAEARAVHAEARSRLERARNRLGDTAIRAPFAGTVGLRYVDVGASVGPQAPVVRLIGGGPVRLRFAVPMADVARVGIGATVVAELAGRAPLSARVASVSPELDQASQLVYVDAELLDDGTEPIAPGLPAEVRCADPGCAPVRAGGDDGQ